MSPEQTGRVNRALDARSDCYSLGVTLYEMLTGRLPFDAADPLELIHSHIAKRPAAPADVAPGVPRPVSDIVMRLLAKAPEDRYQSATGVGAELAACLAEWDATGTVTGVTAGQADVRDRFEIPQRLYGRGGEVQQLLEAFERVADGAVELIMVSGYAGIGKTSLIRELYAPAVRERGYVVAGKFDQIVRIPYGAFIGAFRGLAQQLLTEGEAELDQWRIRLGQALGPGAAVLAEVIPEIEAILGRQLPDPRLGPAEARNRFRRVLENFGRELDRSPRETNGPVMLVTVGRRANRVSKWSYDKGDPCWASETQPPIWRSRTSTQQGPSTVTRSASPRLVPKAKKPLCSGAATRP